MTGYRSEACMRVFNASLYWIALSHPFVSSVFLIASSHLFMLHLFMRYLHMRHLFMSHVHLKNDSFGLSVCLLRM